MIRPGDQVRGLVLPVRGRIGTVVAIERDLPLKGRAAMDGVRARAGHVSATHGCKILAVDPGPKQSAWCEYAPEAPIKAGILPNEELLSAIRSEAAFGHLAWDCVAIEMIASYGMSVGREVFETCVWIGRFVEAWGGPHVLIPRLDVKMAICRNSRANDSNIRRALLDRFGEQGTKKAPGPTYGLAGDQWSALAVAVTYADRQEGSGCRHDAHRS